MNRTKSPKGGVFEAFERERDTSSIETREKTKKMGSEQHIFQNGNLSASILLHLIAFKQEGDKDQDCGYCV